MLLSITTVKSVVADAPGHQMRQTVVFVRKNLIDLSEQLLIDSSEQLLIDLSEKMLFKFLSLSHNTSASHSALKGYLHWRFFAQNARNTDVDCTCLGHLECATLVL